MDLQGLPSLDDISCLVELPLPPLEAPTQPPRDVISCVGADRIGVRGLGAVSTVTTPPRRRASRGANGAKPAKPPRKQAAFSEQPSDNIHICTPTRELDIVRAFASIGLDPCGSPASTVGARVEFWGLPPMCAVCGVRATHGVLSSLRAERCEAHREKRRDAGAPVALERIPDKILNDSRYGKDGLTRSWQETIAGDEVTFLQPPYGRFIVPWIAKANAEAAVGTEIVGLLPGRFDTKWFRAMRPSRICWYHRRIPYVDHTKPDQKDSAKFPSVFAYWGADGERFERTFERYGTVTDWKVGAPFGEDQSNHAYPVA